MAALFALWLASCASLYAQLREEHDAPGGVLEAFPDQTPLLQANVITSALLGFLLLLKVRKGIRDGGCLQQLLLCAAATPFYRSRRTAYYIYFRHARPHCSILVEQLVHRNMRGSVV